MLRKLACLGSKARSSLESWSTPCIEAVYETADNIFNPNATLLFLAKLFHSAQSFQQRHENGDALGTTLKRQVKKSGEMIEVAFLKFESLQIILIPSVIG
jgi:hypothetical protein